VFAVVLSVCAEAQASSSSSRVLQQGEEDGEKLTVALLSRQPAGVADVASLSSHLCFVVLLVSFVFHFSRQQCSCLSAVASWRCCWLRRRGRWVVVSGGRSFSFFCIFFFFLLPSACFCFSSRTARYASSIFLFCSSVLLSLFLCAVHPLAFIARGCKRFPLQGRSNGWKDISRGHGPLITTFATTTVSPPATM